MKRRNANWRIGAVVAGLGTLLALALWFWLRHPADTAPARADTAGSRPARADTVDAKPHKRRHGNGQPKHRLAGQTNSYTVAKADEPSRAETANAEEEESEPASAEERLVEAFDSLTDAWREPAESDVPMAEVEKFRQQFNKIPDNRKEECLHRALNLLPDENAMLLMGILLDKEQPAEYLELVFNDVLNRSEDVKNPLLRLIYKDKEHPCWASTAWILDVTGATPEK